MGHLINPIAFRLGVNRSWENTWFVRNLYYPEFLHNSLNLRNYIYFLFGRKSVLETGVLLSEMIFFKWYKAYVIKIYIYHLSLEKTSYSFINKIYESYYRKKEKIDGKKPILPRDYWVFQNCDLYAMLFVFYTIFFRSLKFRRPRRRVSKNSFFEEKTLGFNFDIDEDLYVLMDKFNQKTFKRLRIKPKSPLKDYLNFYFENLNNKWEKAEGHFDLLEFKKEMWRDNFFLKKRFRYNFKKERKILSILENIPVAKDKLKSFLKKQQLSRLYFFFLLYYNLAEDDKKFNLVLQKQKEDKKNFLNIPIESKKRKKEDIERKKSKIFFNFFFKRHNPIAIGRKQVKTYEYDYDKHMNSSNNSLDDTFLNVFFYLARKVDFKKYKNHLLFKKKWSYILKFLKFLNTFKYATKFKTSIFFLYLSISLYLSMKAEKARKIFYFRNHIHHIIYIWLGQVFFFKYFEKIAKIILNVSSYIISIQHIKLNFLFISSNEVSAWFIARYIGSQLIKNHSLKTIINPVKRELWRLSWITSRVVRNSKWVIKRILKSKKRKIKKIFKLIFKKTNDKIYRFIQENLTCITLDIFRFKFIIFKNKILNLKRFKILYEYLKAELYFFFFYGKIQENLKSKFFEFEFKIKKKKSKELYKNLFFLLERITYINIKKFKILNINYLLVVSNIIKYYMHFNFFRPLWAVVSGFNKRDSRKNFREYKNSSLVAFKMAFKGRFSRKQRASSIWYSHGRTSLNRLDIKVDYAFVKAPLKNSIVSIKIWLFRNSRIRKSNYIIAL